ncbi:exportin-4-like isoform X1 [Dermacentor andersoni]|uniref:exportin-4-like isoform X1 n=1 Tax=Dermacentor andersoni TaxID=34620 RepID=UPI002155D4B8|nr:exportin-4-like isoform X1 [Dermacentor andersoni]
MAAHVMQELESSAQILLAPPDRVTAEQRHAAERTFLDFQNTRAPFELCKCILETSAVGYVQFQAASLLKQGLIREWKFMEVGQWSALSQHLLQLLACRPNMENYVREELALVLALGSKRASVDDGAMALNDILQQSTQMVASGDQHLQSIGCSILSALLVEFSSSTRATDVGLTWEVHLRAKKSFEANHLRKVFQFCQQGLREAANRLGTGPVRPEDRNLLRRLLLLSEQLLSWNFQFSMLLPRKLVGLFEAQQTPTLRPGLEWKGAFDETPQLLLQLYGALSQDGELAHVALQCLLQLATLSHSGEREHRNTHLKRFLQGGLLDLMAVRPPRAGITQLLARLALFHPPALLPSQVHLPYLERLCDLASCVLQTPVGEDAEQQQEALDHILDAWVPLFQEPAVFPAEPLKVATMRVFELYLRSRLAAPDGTRPPINDDEEVAEEDEDDRVRFRDQLSVVGMLGRHVLPHSLPLLCRVVEDRTQRLQELLQGQPQADSPMTAAHKELLEDLHWIVLITGHLLTTVCEGETPLIPKEVTQFSLNSGADTAATLSLLSRLGQADAVSSVQGNVDPVVRLIVAVLQLCHVERAALQAGLGSQLSPEVAITLVWFLHRWGLTYLLPNETYYTQESGIMRIIFKGSLGGLVQQVGREPAAPARQMSPTLVAAFGRDSEAGPCVLDWVLGKLCSNLELWHSETALTLSTCQAMVSLLNNVERGHRAAACPSLLSLLQRQSQGQLGPLAPGSHRALLKALVIACTANRLPEAPRLWEALLGPLKTRFDEFFESCVQTRCRFTEPQKSKALDLLESLCGVAEGTTPSNLTTIRPMLLPLLVRLSSIVAMLRSEATLIAATTQLFRAAARRMLCFVGPNDATQLCHCCLELVRLFASHSAGLFTTEATAEDSHVRELGELLELLTELLSKDFLYMGGPSTATAQARGAANSNATDEAARFDVPAPGIAVEGLRLLMPLLNAQLLQFPTLCMQYFKLVALLSELHPDRVCQMPEELLQALLGSIRVGLTSYSPDVSGLCLDVVSVLALEIHRQGLQTGPAGRAIEPFLQLLLEMVLLQPVDAELTLLAGSALFALLCCFQESFAQLAQALVASQQDPAVGQRLAQSLEALTRTQPLTPERPNRLRFRDSFEAFVTEVRGFLCVK